jgi:mono/diheme cytochrome c family protein
LYFKPCRSSVIVTEDASGLPPARPCIPGLHWALILLFSTVLWRAAGEEAQRWLEMDYGPYLTASIEAPEPRTNIAYKGVAINLGANFGGLNNEAIVFDTDLLRYSAGWTGNFVALKGVVFDGEHWAYPRISGNQIFGNPMAPGWAKAGSFADPREYRFGPLPREWAHWKGLYLREKQVVLSYSVGATSILEMPSLERQDQAAAFVRTLNLGASGTTNAVQVASGAVARPELLHLSRLDPAGPTTLANECLAVVPGIGSGNTNVLATALLGNISRARWLTTEKGEIRLELPGSTEPMRCKILIWSGPRRELSNFVALVHASPPPINLELLTNGGNPRWPEKLATEGQQGTNSGPYAIDTLTEPDSNPWHSWMRFGGIDFFPDGKRAAVCTWNGDVWIISGVEGDLRHLTWQRIATGLFQPLGLQIVDGQIYVLGRDQITRLHDLNGDGEIDFYENFNNDCMTSEHFHEFALDLKLGHDGNFYYIKCACHGLPASHPHHGTLMRVSRDGSKLEVVARGFRAANGLGVGPHGEFTCIDNQGYWMPANRINWIKPGGWYGNQWAWNPTGRTNYDEPLCWMHNFVDRSGGTQLWVPTDQWGPFKGEIITLSYGMGHMFLLLKESVDGVMQGGVTRFPLEFDTGVMRGVFHPQTGQLYGCGLYGWASNKTKPGGVYRIRYTGSPVNMPQELHFVRDGIVLGFTDPLDPTSASDPGNYDVQAWNYHWTINYGSPDFKLNGQEGRDIWTVNSAALSEDKKRVFLKIPEVQPVMQVHVTFNLKAANGGELQNFVHGTIHKLDRKSGEDLLGPGAITRHEKVEVKLTREMPGLIQSFSRVNNPGADDIRSARLPALFVPVGESPTPFLEPGRFRNRWRGFLKVDLNQDATFETAGAGTAVLKINGRTLLDSRNAKLQGLQSQSVILHRGLNPFDLEYESPTNGAAQFQLAWQSGRLPLEPVPATAFVHDDDPELAHRELVRTGRQLFAELRCIRCHQEKPPAKTGMPELAADAPRLEGIGSRLNQAWIAQWVLDPKKLRPDASMPRLLAGSDPGQDSLDIAAYLGGLTENPAQQAETETNSPANAGMVAAGGKLFQDLGCAGCHRVAGQVGLTNDTRLSLLRIVDKWKFRALTDYLKAPEKFFRWTRMPDFKLSHEEAETLSSFLYAQSEHSPTEETTQHPGHYLANPKRGEQLVESVGCLNCHDIEKTNGQIAAMRIAPLTHEARGCLAEDQSVRGKAPDFNFSGPDRGALRAFLHEGFPGSLQRDSRPEFAERAYVALRCQACHPRDTQTDVLTQVAAATPQPMNAVNETEIAGTQSVHVGRPSLTFAGEKLYSGWMKEFLEGTLPYKPRPELQGRMPSFPVYAAGLAEGLAHEHGYPAESAPPSKTDEPLAEIGRKLIGVTDGFSCVACHNVGKQKALAGKDTATVNFDCIADRLRPSYYWRYVQDPPHLLPGTMMPKFIGEDGTTPVKKVFNGDPQKQFTAIWNYLLTLRAGNDN